MSEGKRDERWHHWSDEPVLRDGETSVRLIAEIGDEAGVDTIDLYWSKRTKGFCGYSVTRWRYWPEPPTPEQEERARLERDVVAKMVRLARHTIDPGYCDPAPWLDWPAGSLDILREWAAKGGDA